MSAHSSNASSYRTAALVGAVGAVGSAVAVGIWMERRRKNRHASGRRRSSDDAESDAMSVEGSVMVTLPPWAIAASPDYFARCYKTDEEMMSLAVHLSDRNITEGTGGPFGAAIFERHPKTGECVLVSIGMNRVVPLGNSTLHGETVAIQLAQRRVGSYTLRLDASDHEDGLFYDDDCETNEEEEGAREKDKNDDATETTAKTRNGEGRRKRRRFELFTSCEPCAMCLGATLWSGVSRIVCGAAKADAQAIGFDEGPVYEESYRHLERCGVCVTRNVLPEEAAEVLRRYGREGLIYNR